MSEKKRSRETPKKGYRIIASIERIEGDEQPEVIIISKKTIGTIDASCEINMKKTIEILPSRG